jgi:hypothetical protein
MVSRMKTIKSPRRTKPTMRAMKAAIMRSMKTMTAMTAAIMTAMETMTAMTVTMMTAMKTTAVEKERVFQLSQEVTLMSLIPSQREPPVEIEVDREEAQVDREEPEADPKEPGADREEAEVDPSTALVKTQGMMVIFLNLSLIQKRLETYLQHDQLSPKICQQSRTFSKIRPSLNLQYCERS